MNDTCYEVILGILCIHVHSAVSFIDVPRAVEMCETNVSEL